jgi:hypothetical protein
MKKNQDGFAILAIVIPTILIGLAVGGYYAYNAILLAKDKATSSEVGFAIQSIYYHATSTQISPATLEEADSKLSTSKLEYKKLGDSDYWLCANFYKVGGDKGAPGNLLIRIRRSN